MNDNKNQVLFSVFFDDNTHFLGGINYFETKWLEIPNKKIKRILYKLPDGNHICLSNYDKYYHMVEALKDITGKSKGKTQLEYAYIMGLKDNVVTSYRITLYNKSNDRYKRGDIVRRTFEFEDKKIQKLNSIGWKG